MSQQVIRFEIGWASHTGMVRQVNEDNYFIGSGNGRSFWLMLSIIVAVSVTEPWIFISTQFVAAETSAMPGKLMTSRGTPASLNARSMSVSKLVVMMALSTQLRASSANAK